MKIHPWKWTFFVRDADSLVPVEVKAVDGAIVSLNHLIDWKFYTFPYFLAFLLKRFLRERGNHAAPQMLL